MNNEELALLLGMLCGDGCLIEMTKRKGGYKSYATNFYNSNLDIIKSFDDIFLKVFKVKGNFYPDSRKDKKKVSYVFRSYSKKVFNKIASWGFPIGLKKYKLRVPSIINDFNEREKILFLKGFVITDGSIRKQGNILFHVATKKFLEDIADLIYELFNLRKTIKEYIQREKFQSYQLLLDKKEAQIVLNSSLM